jgi:DUF1365 family protein
MHARARPAVHKFFYSVFFLRFPLSGLKALDRAAPRWLGVNRAAPLSFHFADHGDGGSPAEWIARLLCEHDIADADGEVWLQTFPRVFGYVFNPVSFWFCERADSSTRAIVVEVNNTFGERHCYLIAQPDGGALLPGVPTIARKVFHVSPFARVEGEYQFRFMATRRDGAQQVVARINFADTAGRLIDTSVSGRSVGITAASLARTVLRFPLFTLGVVARIHWQALRLWLKRVPFFRKPAPPADFVTRSL